jgi:Fic family protein
MLSRIRDFYKVGLVYSSNAIEGFSYDETETKVLIEDGLTAAGKPLSHALAVIGHAEGYDRMFGLLYRNSISEEDLLMFHACLAGSLDNEARPGEYRDCNIFLTGSDQIFPSPEEIPGRMSDLMASYARNSGKLHPVEAAAKFHAWLTIIHPFADGNGRVARLAANAILHPKWLSSQPDLPHTQEGLYQMPS